MSADPKNHEDVSDGETPELEVDASGRKLSKAEKKVRKTLSKAGLVAVPDITRVTLKRGKNAVFAISNPEVFKAPAANTFVIYGEAQTEDFANQLRQQAGAFNAVPSAVDATAEEPEDETEQNADGLAEDEIESVMTQGNCSRNRAIKALREKGGDVIEAILSVS
jgi:nascent polypeptide-associated complex subunit alpha